MKRTIIISVIIVISIIIISLGIFICFSFFGTPWERAQFKSHVESYLENRYYENMKIKSIGYDFVTREYCAAVSPTDNPEITFRAWSFRNHYNGSTEKEVADDYFQSTFEWQINTVISKYASKVFKTKCDGRIACTQFNQSTLKYPFTYKEYKEEKGIPYYISIIDRFDTSLIYTFIDVPYAFKQNNSSKEYKRIYQMANHVFNSYTFKEISITYSNNIQYRIKIEDFMKLKKEDDISKFKVYDE